MILTLYVLLMPIYILLISPTNFTINLQQDTKYSATVLKAPTDSVRLKFLNLRKKLSSVIIQFTVYRNELLRFHYRMAASKPTSYS
jgi:hypothetical protein